MKLTAILIHKISREAIKNDQLLRFPSFYRAGNANRIYRHSWESLTGNNYFDFGEYVNLSELLY